ncbi:Sphingosine-1-phosphate lyase 1 isoform 2 [Schistosoma japonicum]|uniref:sphinganine-1-phosphate aldolase n=1 Tax=Schistosoma japonicum TaxID=6182 RepID=A0A4Z2DU11_SCHJA|nr:Sphingosine-1-phosphate lyase 1 isoform 2 [Schistosoma japonicum]
MDNLPLDVISTIKLGFNLYIDHLSNCDFSAVLVTFVAFILLLSNFKLFDSTFKRSLYTCIRNAPFIRSYIKNKIDKASKEIHRDIHEKTSHVVYEKKLPICGQTAENVLSDARKYKMLEYIKWDEGFVSGIVYPRDDKLSDLCSNIYKEFLWTNPVHPELFVDIRRMEAEVIRMCVTMFHGDKDACGTTTSGGTESILLACLAYRQLARERGIEHPAMVIPVSAHPAFDKAAHYFCIKVVHVPLDPVTYKVDMIEMKSSITRDTCMLVGSAPGFPHGIIDPIKDIAELGQKYNIPVHVDCCLGGFLLPFMEKVNYPIEEFDFRLPGVTSISCDTHKYGFAPKGTSIIMYRDQYYRSRQYFTQTTWPGGLYASSTLPGSRPGALIATCWAALMYHGESGYCKSTKRIISTTRYITDELRKIPGINILGQPNVSIVAFGSNNFNIYKLGHALLDKPNGRGWNLNNLQFPPAIHFCVTDMHTVKGCADKFIHDVKEAVKELRKTPNTKPEGSAALYGLSHMIPDRSIVEELAHCYLDAYYDTPSND